MGIDSHFIHIADHQRAETRQDGYNASAKTWKPWLADVRGRLVIKTQVVSASEFAEQPVVTTYRWLVSPRVEVEQGDRIVNVRDRKGVVDAGPFQIKEVMKRSGQSARHISLLLERV